MSEQNNSIPKRSAFSVFSQVDGKKYKVVVKEGDLPKLKVEKIKRNLSKVTGIPAEDQVLYSEDVELHDEMSGAEFGLNEHSTLILVPKSHPLPKASIPLIPSPRPPFVDAEQYESPQKVASPPPASRSPTFNSQNPITPNYSRTSSSPSISSNEKDTHENSFILQNNYDDRGHTIRSRGNNFPIQTENHSNQNIPNGNGHDFSPPSVKHSLNEGKQEQTFEGDDAEEGQEKGGPFEGMNQYESSRDTSIYEPPPSLISSHYSRTPLSSYHNVEDSQEQFDRQESQSQYNNHMNNSSYSTHLSRSRNISPKYDPPKEKKMVEEKIAEEKAKLSRTWASEKREILRQANEDRQELMMENQRLRKELSIVSLRNNIEKGSYTSDQEDKLKEDNKTLLIKCERLERELTTMRSNTKSPSNPQQRTSEVRDFQIQWGEIEKQKTLMREEKNKWEKEKENILRNWREENEILFFTIEEKNKRFKQEMNKMNDMMSRANDTIEALNQMISQQSKELEIQQRKIEEYQEEIKKSNSKALRNALYVQSADSAISDLRTQFQSLLNGDENASSLITQYSTQIAMERKKCERLLNENHTLSERLQEEGRKRKLLHNTLEDMKGNIRVITRLRPLLPGERIYSSTAGKVEVRDETTVGVSTPSTGLKCFEFYRVFGENASQMEVFEDIKPLLQSAIDGYNVCIMAYGQTGSGKSYTIYGEQSNPEWMGVLPRACNELFSLLKKATKSAGDEICLPEELSSFSIRCSMVELYMDTFNDLLDMKKEDKKIEIHQNSNGATLYGASEHSVSTPNQLMDFLVTGNKNRQIHSTDMNDRSSRSHTIFIINLVLNINSSTKSSCTKSKLVFVDLAGSERISRSHSVGDRFKEAQHINKSLSSLGDVVFALSMKKGHIPYRNSKLTSLLQDVLGGNSKTVMFANISPCPDSISETLSTLSFASRVKKVHNTISKNYVVKK